MCAAVTELDTRPAFDDRREVAPRPVSESKPRALSDRPRLAFSGKDFDERHTTREWRIRSHVAPPENLKPAIASLIVLWVIRSN
jgi:hypothetical protein